MEAGQSCAERGDEPGVSSSHLGASPAQSPWSHLSQEPKTPCRPSSGPRAELFLLPISRGRFPLCPDAQGRVRHRGVVPGPRLTLSPCLTGMLVVNVTWRNKTYVGTLLDCTQHDWAPPR